MHESRNIQRFVRALRGQYHYWTLGLTLVAQGVQLIGVSTPVFTWMLRFGFSSRVKVHVIASDIPGESYFGFNANVHLGEEGALAFGHPHPAYEGYVLAFNLLAFAIMLTAWFLFREKQDAGKVPE